MKNGLSGLNKQMKIRRQFSLTLASVIFVCGVCIFQAIHTLPNIGWFYVVICLFALCVWRKFYYPLFFMMGLCWAWGFATWSLASRLPKELEGNTLTGAALILSIPDCNEKVCRFNALFSHSRQLELSAKHSDNSDRTVDLKKNIVQRKIRLNWYSPPNALVPGQSWLLKVRLKQPHGMMNPGGFDYEQWLFSQGIDATGYVRCEDCQLLSGSGYSVAQSVHGWVQQQRQLLYQKLQAALEHSKVSGLISGIVVGIREDITALQWNILRKTGTAHLMAISGLHIGLIAGLTFWLFRWVVAWVGILHWSPHHIAAVGAMSCATGYAMLAGLSLPTQRALIMLGIVFGAVILQAKIRPAHLLAITAVAVVVINPLAVLSAGFWLSFGAVAIISLMLVGRLRTGGYWSSTWTVAWRVALGLSPLLLLFFGSVSLIAPIANLIAVPVVSLVVVPASLFGAVISSFSESIASVIFNFSSLVLSVVMAYLEQLSLLKYSAISLSKPSLWAIISGIFGVILILSPRGVRYKWLGLILLLPALFPDVNKIDQGQFKVTVLDVGQGLSSVIETANHTLVFDAGIRLSAKFDMGTSVLLPYLRSRSIQHVDLLVLSHPDSDHIGGAQALLTDLPVDNQISSYPKRVPGHAVQLCQPGRQWQWDGVQFLILAPLRPFFIDENNNSCVIKVNAGHDGLLLTGDIESEAESRLIKEYGNILKSRLLVVPHHGSKTSSSAHFLDSVDPALAIIPAGYRNQYGFPHKKVVKEYQVKNIPLLNTAHSGAVSVILGSKQSLQGVTKYREQSRRYWNQN